MPVKVKQIIKEQRVVRTYPRDCAVTIDYLRDKLEQGYHVVYCNKIGDVLEYIVEIEREIEIEEEELRFPIIICEKNDI